MNLHENMYSKFVDEEGHTNLISKFHLSNDARDGLIVEIKSRYWWTDYRIIKPDEPEDRSVICTGSLKWDGCSDTHFKYFHFCGGATDWILLSKVMENIWNLSRVFMNKLGSEIGNSDYSAMGEFDTKNFSYTTKFLEARPW